MDFIKNYIKGGIHMKYVVYSRFKTEVPYSKTICDNEETLATTIQYLRIDLVTSSVYMKMLKSEFFLILKRDRWY